MLANSSDRPLNLAIVKTLLVNDSPRILKALLQILSRERGFTVVGSATDGSQAVRYAAALAPDFVLMGLHLSKLSGAQATRHIKQGMHPPVIFLLAQDDSPRFRSLSEVAGADALIATSSNLEAGLKRRLREWFGARAAEISERRVTWVSRFHGNRSLASCTR